MLIINKSTRLNLINWKEFERTIQHINKVHQVETGLSSFSWLVIKLRTTSSRTQKQQHHPQHNQHWNQTYNQQQNEGLGV